MYVEVCRSGTCLISKFWTSEPLPPPHETSRKTNVGKNNTAVVVANIVGWRVREVLIVVLRCSFKLHEDALQSCSFHEVRVCCVLKVNFMPEFCPLHRLYFVPSSRIALFSPAGFQLSRGYYVSMSASRRRRKRGDTGS